MNNEVIDSADTNDGVIQFRCQHIFAETVSEEMIVPLRDYRRRALERHWVGVGADGIGFGNMSIRGNASSFVITGSQTGELRDPGPEAYSLVETWDIAGNWLQCRGLCKASSESLTHAALYECSHSIGAVIHIHCQSMWSTWQKPKLRTRESVTYGTPAMASEISRLVVENHLEQTGLLCMGGHPDGLIAWGKNLEEAWCQLTEGFKTNPA